MSAAITPNFLSDVTTPDELVGHFAVRVFPVVTFHKAHINNDKEKFFWMRVEDRIHMIVPVLITSVAGRLYETIKHDFLTDETQELDKIYCDKAWRAVPDKDFDNSEIVLKYKQEADRWNEEELKRTLAHASPRARPIEYPSRIRVLPDPASPIPVKIMSSLKEENEQESGSKPSQNE